MRPRWCPSFGEQVPARGTSTSFVSRSSSAATDAPASLPSRTTQRAAPMHWLLLRQREGVPREQRLIVDVHHEWHRDRVWHRWRLEPRTRSGLHCARTTKSVTMPRTTVRKRHIPEWAWHDLRSGTRHLDGARHGARGGGMHRRRRRVGSGDGYDLGVDDHGADSRSRRAAKRDPDRR